MAQLENNPPATRETRVDPWVGKIPWRRERHPPQDSCLENPMDCSELDTTERLSLHFGGDGANFAQKAIGPLMFSPSCLPVASFR